MRKLLPSIICLLVLVVGCGPRLGRMKASQRSERLAVERGNLVDLTDPLARTQSYIKISNILLSFVADAARAHDDDGLNVLVDQYLTAIRAARDTMVESHHNPKRQPEGYRELERALQAQTRLLQEISIQLLADERQRVQSARDVAVSVQREMLRLLTP
jgi:hypothetical protein